MDGQGFTQWMQQNRPNFAAQLQPSVGEARANLVQQMSAPPPRPTFDPSQGAPAGMGGMGGKPGQFGNSVPGTVGPQYGASGQPPAKPFTPQASSGNIFAAPERGGQNANSSQPMGVRNAPNLFGKGPTAPRGGPAPAPENGGRWGNLGTSPDRGFAGAAFAPPSGFSAPQGPQNPRDRVPNFVPSANAGIGGIPIPTNTPIQGPKKVGG
jgi:hypothetical protein